MLKDVYPDLKRKFKLPDFGDLDREFELSLIEDEVFPLRIIKGRMSEVLHDAVDVFNIILQPNTGSLAELCECRCFSDTEKRQVFDIFRRLMGLVRVLTETHFTLTDADDAAAIRLVAKEWPAIRKDFIPFARKMKECWHRPMTAPEELGYFG